MSTRCQIRIIKDDYILNLYHHHDGYFEGVGKELSEFLKKSEGDIDELIYLIQNDCAYRITFGLHGDIEYFYLINFDTNEFYGWEVNFNNIWNMNKEDKKWFKVMPNVIEDTKINLK